MSSPGVHSPNSPYSSCFRRRTIGRASSPPTWACYEQIPSDDEDDDYNDSPSEDESCSEDGEDYGHHDVDHGTDEEKKAAKFKNDLKGKQRALDPEPASAKKHYHKRERRPTHTLRPILTIQKSQGFVWNQDLFVPPYIKDRYVASTSPPSSKGFTSSSWTSTASSMTDYEVEVVEIRVRDGELYDIIP